MRRSLFALIAAEVISSCGSLMTVLGGGLLALVLIGPALENLGAEAAFGAIAAPRRWRLGWL